METKHSFRILSIVCYIQQTEILMQNKKKYFKWHIQCFSQCAAWTVWLSLRGLIKWVFTQCQ